MDGFEAALGAGGLVEQVRAMMASERAEYERDKWTGESFEEYRARKYDELMAHYRRQRQEQTQRFLNKLLLPIVDAKGAELVSLCKAACLVQEDAGYDALHDAWNPVWQLACEIGYDFGSDDPAAVELSNLAMSYVGGQDNWMPRFLYSSPRRGLVYSCLD